MAEHIRSVQVKIEVDTNKTTYHESFELADDETFKEFIERIQTWTNSILETIR